MKAKLAAGVKIDRHGVVLRVRAEAKVGELMKAGQLDDKVCISDAGLAVLVTTIEPPASPRLPPY